MTNHLYNYLFNIKYWTQSIEPDKHGGIERRLKTILLNVSLEF